MTINHLLSTNNRSLLWRLSLLMLIIISFIVILIANGYPREQQFVFLANSFLAGHTYFVTKPVSWQDTTYFQGHYYWPLGPFPAVLLLPLVSLGFAPSFPYQGVIQFFLLILDFFLLYKIAQKVIHNKSNALWLAWAYLFSSAYLFIALVPASWFLAQVVGNTLILAMIYEYLSRKRWLLIGLYIGLAVATRDNFIFALVFPLFLLWAERMKLQQKISSLCLLLLPVIASVGLLLIYNYVRFHNPFDNGYAHQILKGAILHDRNTYGLWSLAHYPANLYYFFLKGPEAVFLPGSKVLTYPYLVSSYYGMSIFLTSPCFLWTFKAPWKEKLVRAAWLTAVVMLLFMLGFFSRGGFSQYGYRLALDFYPFLFVLLIYRLKHNLPLLFIIVTLLSFLANIYFISYMFFHPISHSIMYLLLS